ncbi:MAG: hypothetical protein IJ685_11190 [Selenomonadaceae bacterium]|nr:hypothetical protein [Selenomonadaceae bacterium]
MKKFFAVAALILGIVVSQFVAVPRAEAVPDGYYGVYYHRCAYHQGETIIRIESLNTGETIGWCDINGNRCESAEYYSSQGHLFYVYHFERYQVENGQWFKR